MAMILHRHTIANVGLGDRAGLEDGRLTVDGAGLRAHLLTADDRLTEVEIAVAHPDEATRIVCVKDVVQPRLALAESDTLRILDGVAVATCGPIVGFQEGIIDMSGPGADYTPFSRLVLVVLRCAVRDGLTAYEHETALREAGLRAAEYLAASIAERTPDAVESVDRPELRADSGLPRIAYVYMVLGQGLLHDTYVLGQDAKQIEPMLIAPEAVMANGVISGNCVSACDKNTTFHHQNNPVIAELLRGHGSAWDFVGVIISNALTRLSEKQSSAAAAVELARGLRADGAIVSKEGFGNPDADLMMLLRGLEQAGIRTVGITDEFAGTDGGSQSLADTVPEADAIVSTGNANARIELPAMQTTIGPLPDVTRLAGGYPHSLHDDGSMEVELQAIIGGTNELGYGRLRCREV